jgi:hypothetical protein
MTRRPARVHLADGSEVIRTSSPSADRKRSEFGWEDDHPLEITLRRRPSDDSTQLSTVVPYQCGPTAIVDVDMRDVDSFSAVKSALAALDAAEDLGAVVDREDVAVEADRSSAAGVLSGRTVTVKDWIDVAGFACEGERQERTGRRPTSVRPLLPVCVRPVQSW